MDALRTIVRSGDDEVTIKLPAQLARRLLEVIVLPLEGGQSPTRRSFLDTVISVPNFVMPSRLERNAR